MHIVDEYMKSRYFAAMKGNYSKKYLSVPLWDKSVTNNIYIYIYIGHQSNAVFITHSMQEWVKKKRSQCFDKGLSRIMIMIVFTEIMIFCMFKWREQFTHSPRPATRHRPDSDSDRSNVGPKSGRQHRWWANAGPTPAAARAGGATASEIDDPGLWVSAINPHTNH